ncbi:choline kinase alpha [Trichoderma asperellum]|uniref:Choline kinase alpha n=1 Tax=Trichoderma asperellum TaxID=101201 RepID=A0A6V8R3E5_TRIAP|nr:choline kinase alpha [Trichoderma asperellum]
MIACVQVPVTITKDVKPTKSVLKDIVSTFLSEWATIDPDYLVVRHDVGQMCAHYFVERPTQLVTESRLETSKVFIKLHEDEATGVEVFEHLVPSKDAEAALVQQFGKTSYGPKMIGFFQTNNGVRGRIDELIDSRTLEPEDVEDETIRADIAKAFATFHALEAPFLLKKSVDSYQEAVIRGLNKYHKMTKLKSLAREGGVDIDELVDYDFTSKLREIVDRLASMGAKEGWCIHDVQFGNVLLKDDVKRGESKIALIDFEFVFRNYRAFDIGGHWFQKMFKWTNEVSKIVDCKPYTDEEKKQFCQVYAKKWNEITGDNDTCEQVLAESTLGYILALSFDIHFMLMAMDEDDNTDPLDALALKKLFDEFTKQYALL